MIVEVKDNNQKEYDGSDIVADTHTDDVLKFKKRMLQWPNPVEYVNNMYGCHPDDRNRKYFEVIFNK